MGGYGSGRNSNRPKKTQVEEGFKLSMKTIFHHLQPGYSGSVIWSQMGMNVGKISYFVTGLDTPKAVRLMYIQTNRINGEKTDYDYPVTLTTTFTPWNSIRYWFCCPLSSNETECNQHVGVLYLPPGGHYFGCRHCYNLTYHSCQEEHQFDSFYKNMAASMQDTHPGFTHEDVRCMLDPDRGLRCFSPWFKRMLMSSMQDFDPYPGYLTASELCAQSELTLSDLSRLEAARLLLTDRPSGLYRPKLVGWAQKLAYLITEGWSLDEMRAWANGRWSTPDPRAWPPERERWRVNN